MYVTDDKRVQLIQKMLKSSALNESQARKQIEALPPQKTSKFGYLPWEVEEAMRAA